MEGRKKEKTGVKQALAVEWDGRKQGLEPPLHPKPWEACLWVLCQELSKLICQPQGLGSACRGVHVGGV